MSPFFTISAIIGLFSKIFFTDNRVEELNDLIIEGRIFISIVPDIESVNYGRGVGYEVIEHVPPSDINEVSATKIRAKMRKDGKL